MLGACRLGCGGSGWLGTGDGAAHLRCPPRAFLSPVTLPDTFSGSCLGPSPLYPSFHPYLLTNLPTQTSTSVRRMASSVGPARCVSTPVAATSVWTRHVLPPTGRAPAPGKGGVGCGVNGADCLPGADPLAPVQPDSTSRQATSQAGALPGPVGQLCGNSWPQGPWAHLIKSTSLQPPGVRVGLDPLISCTVMLPLSMEPRQLGEGSWEVDTQEHVDTLMKLWTREHTHRDT